MPDAVQDRDISERGGVSPPVLGRKGLCIYYFREFMGVME